MNRNDVGVFFVQLSMPHVGGDEPIANKNKTIDLMYAPRRWG